MRKETAHMQLGLRHISGWIPTSFGQHRRQSHHGWNHDNNAQASNEIPR
jgi:hypothetical protein